MPASNVAFLEGIILNTYNNLEWNIICKKPESLFCTPETKINIENQLQQIGGIFV